MTNVKLPQVLRVYGAKKRVAKALGISTAAVTQWKRVPEARVVEVAAVLGVLLAEIRPDLYDRPAPAHPHEAPAPATVAAE